MFKFFTNLVALILMLLPFYLIYSWVFSDAMSMDDYPKDQQIFINEIEDISDRWSDAQGTNRLAEEDLIKEMDAYLSNVKNKSVKNWVGRLDDIFPEKLYLNTYHGSKFILRVKGEQNLYSVIDRETLSKLEGGEILTFSGILVGEGSITTSGKMGDPEFDFEVKEISILE